MNHYHQSTISGERQRDAPDLLEYRRILLDAHRQQLLGAPALVQHVVGVRAQLLHVRPHEHLPQLAKVAVRGVIHLDDAPRIRASADHTAVGCPCGTLRPNDGEGDGARDFLRLGDALFILVLVQRRLEDLNAVECEIGQNLNKVSEKLPYVAVCGLTRSLKSAISSSFMVSALAMTGIRLTLLCSRRMNSMSICFNLGSRRSIL